jgi:hypothetical protein
MRHTMKALRNTLALMLVALVYQQTCLAQVDPWERVKLIEEGRKVQVKLLSGKTLNGKMEAWSTDGLSIRQGKDKRVVPVAKSDVTQVAFVTGMSRGRKAAYAGVITGGVLGGLTLLACAKSDCDIPPAAVPVILGFYGGIAAGIAALFPQHKEVIYAAPAGGASKK